jgi:hypothetical protein
MANVKNFGLEGVASSVQLGKGGATLQGSASSVAVKTADGSALVNLQAADPVAAQDVVTKGVFDALNGGTVQLGNPQDGTLNDGAVQLTTSTTVTTAVDKLNEILGKLVPTAPANFPGGQTLSLSGAGTALLASGSVADNTGGGTLPVTAGSSVTRVTAATVSSTTIGDNGSTGFVGPGDSGTVQAVVNGAVVDSQAMSGGVAKSTGVLRISNDTAYPAATPGFWYSFRASISGASATQGWNRIALNDTASGATATNDVYFVRDNLTANPVVSSGTVVQGTAGTLAYSSSVPHYNTGATLTVGFTATNIAGETYSSGNILSVAGSNGILSTVGYAAGSGGLSSPVARQTLSFTASGLSIPVSGTNVFASGQITATATNPNGSGNATFGPNILVMNGTASSKLYEMNVPVTVAVNGGPSGNSTRVTMSNGDNPSDDKSSLTTGDWNSSSALQVWDATVVAGVLKNDLTDYSTYLPAGPNLTTQNATQYVTFMFRRTAVSKFDIAVTGTYAGMWIKAVGLTEQYTASANGWYSMSASYAGSGFPGDQAGANGSLGCALGGTASGSGSFTATLGTLSSTNATNNIIMVRFKLTAGQSITALSFVPATH